MAVLQQFLNDIAYVLECTCANINGDGTDTRVEIGSYQSGFDQTYTACCAVLDSLDNKKYHTDDMITCIAHLRNTQNQKICSVCNDITEPSTPSTDPEYTIDYDNAYLTGVHPDLCAYTPSGKYAQGTMYHMPESGNMSCIAAMSENQPYALCAGTDGCVVWCCSGTTGTACHLYGPASLCFNCGGYVSAGTEWSFGGANCNQTITNCQPNTSKNGFICFPDGYYTSQCINYKVPNLWSDTSVIPNGERVWSCSGNLVTGKMCGFVKTVQCYSQSSGPTGWWNTGCFVAVACLCSNWSNYVRSNSSFYILPTYSGRVTTAIVYLTCCYPGPGEYYSFKSINVRSCYPDFCGASGHYTFVTACNGSSSHGLTMQRKESVSGSVCESYFLGDIPYPLSNCCTRIVVCLYACCSSYSQTVPTNCIAFVSVGGWQL